MDELSTAVVATAWAMSLADAVVALQAPDGGFSLDPRTLTSVRGGYAVACHVERGVTLASAREGDLLEFLLRNGDVLASSGAVFGGWHDPSDHRVYLDVSMLIADRSEALRLAVLHDQLAIWSFDEGRSIPTY